MSGNVLSMAFKLGAALGQLEGYTPRLSLPLFSCKLAVLVFGGAAQGSQCDSMLDRLLLPFLQVAARVCSITCGCGVEGGGCLLKDGECPRYPSSMLITLSLVSL